jgi:hypothetical protein
MSKRAPARKRRDRREADLSRYGLEGKTPFKYPFPIGADYAHAVSMGSIGDPGERFRRATDAYKASL